jgi:hypothetical protein
MESEQFTGRSVEMKKETPWLSSEDLLDAGDVIVEISGVYKHKGVKFDDGREMDVFALAFKGKAKQLVLNSTNRRALVSLFGTTKVNEWVGKKVTLYVAHDVRKPGGRRGETTCGIRIRT